MICIRTSIFFNSKGQGWCAPFIGISSIGNIIVQVYRYTGPYMITGPAIQLNTWTHMVQTYSPTNGQSLYVNGILYTTLSNATIYTASGVQNYVTIGNLLNVTSCYNPGILQTPIQGIIDELRIYSRELSSTDACPLAWPYIGNCSFFLSYMFVLPLLFSFTSTCRMKYNY